MEYDDQPGPCIRCGLCCIIVPCAFSGCDEDPSLENECPNLEVHEDLTTSCHDKDAVSAFVEDGIGCIFQTKAGQEVFKFHHDSYCITEKKEELFNKTLTS